MPTININFSDEHNDYFTLTDDAGNSYQWHGRKGVVQNPEEVLKLIKSRLERDNGVWVSTHPVESEDKKYMKQLEKRIKALEDKLL